MMPLPLRLKVELRDLVELVLVPGLAAVLPWRFCFRLFRWLCSKDFLYREAARVNCANAQAYGLVGDPAEWQRRWRLVTLVDHADFYLARTRGDAWMRRHMEVVNAWPSPDQAALTLTFHWGAGMWALRHLAASGLHVHALLVAPRRENCPGRLVQYLYSKARFQAARDALGYDPLDISASMRPVLEAFRDGHQVGGAIDVPPFMVASTQSIPFLGRQARFPRGLLRVAADRGIPVTIFLNGVRLTDGHRFLRIHCLGVEEDLDTLMRKAFAFLESALREEPAAWHFWGMVGEFTRPPDTNANSP